jgi:hypothetical protein
MEADGSGFEAELTRLAGAPLEPGTAFADVAGLTEEPYAARVEGEWRAAGSSGAIECIGRAVRTSGVIDWSRVELVRTLTVSLDEGSLLAVAAARPAGAAGHGDEAVSALLAEPDGGTIRFDEPLLSTEYDPGGEPRRVGIELWPQDEEAVAMRGAGTVLSQAPGAAFLAFTLDGRTGTARYAILRSA